MYNKFSVDQNTLFLLALLIDEQYPQKLCSPDFLNQIQYIKNHFFILICTNTESLVINLKILSYYSLLVDTGSFTVHKTVSSRIYSETSKSYSSVHW